MLIITHSDIDTSPLGIARAVYGFIDHPLRILLILVLAFIITHIIKRAIVRFVKKVLTTADNARLQKSGIKDLPPTDEKHDTRTAARAETLGHVLRSVAISVVWGFAALLVLEELGVNIGPLIAGAGIGGLALGFGSQSIVKDFLSGMFMLIEDHYGVGDIVDLNFATGTVEEISLRSTAIRDIKGTVWHVPNGQINRVGNFSQLWSRALIDIEVPHDTDLRYATEIINETSEVMWNDPKWGEEKLAEQPSVWGVQQLSKTGIILRVAAKTKPSKQSYVECELRLRLIEALDDNGIKTQAA